MVKTVIDQHQFTAMYLSTSPIPGNREQPLSYVMRRMMVHEHFPSL
jgi:CMP-2-keto-3-deoxyoctulosonic acid synthetase